MKKTLIAIAALLAFSAPALGDFDTVSLAHEVALNDLRAPSSQFASISFKECAECERVSVRLTGKTLYVVDGRTVTFDRFWELAEASAAERKVPATVLHHLQSDTVVKISFNR